MKNLNFLLTTQFLGCETEPKLVKHMVLKLYILLLSINNYYDYDITGLIQFVPQVKVPTWINGIEDREYVGVGARFGPTLESKEKRANHTKVVLADPPDCCSKPKNNVFSD